MGYRLTVAAAGDLSRIYTDGIHKFGRIQSDKYYDELIESLEFLARFPRAARDRKEFSPPVRIHPVGAHVVIFVREHDGILVVRVLHGRQDWESHL